ncbi:hypothetical protein RIF29_00271 [Crotalaria pallida]|uniref:non-specific serine/threonine protein kinase n=1 Tax=Crotalaria pallida TaxID=3830 RepID=A0AAN9IWC6_CROPI
MPQVHYRNPYCHEISMQSVFVASCNRHSSILAFGYAILEAIPSGIENPHIQNSLPRERITIDEIMDDEWFKIDYKPPVFDEKAETSLDDVEVVFKDCEEHHVTEKKEEQPTTMNAFELICMSKGLILENLFDEQGFKRETRFTSKSSANEIINKIEEAAKPLGFVVQKKNYKMRLANVKAGRKGNLNVATEIFQVAPSLHMVEVRKAKGDTLEFHKLYKNLSTCLEDVVWKTEDDMQMQQAK